MLTIWSNAAFSGVALGKLEDGVRGYRILRPAKLEEVNLVAGEADPQFFEAEVALGQPDVGQIMESKRLRWVHLTSAGYTRYDRQDLRESCQRRGVVITNSSHVYDEPCAQHLLAMMMGMGRQLPTAAKEQFGAKGWPSARLRAGCRLMAGEKVLIYGFGTIARRLVELLAPLRMKVIGVRRKPAGDEGIQIVTDGDEMIGQADHVINILPANESTAGYFDQQRFEKMKRGVLFYNIGRGTTVDQKALLAALESGKVAGAYLDVTEPEPLPTAHPLWMVPNCWITPHMAGGHATEFERLAGHFLENLRRFERKEKLLDRVI